MTQSATATAVAPTYVEEARRYREQGGYRPELVDYLSRCGVDPASAEHLADRFDLELGLAGHPHPHDINPAVAKQLDAHWELMATMAPVPPVAAEPAAVDQLVAAEPAVDAVDIARGLLPSPSPLADNASISALEIANPEAAVAAPAIAAEDAGLAVPVADIDAEIAAAQLSVHEAAAPAAQFPPAAPVQFPPVHVATEAPIAAATTAHLPDAETIRATVRLELPVEHQPDLTQFPPVAVVPTLADTQAGLASATPPYAQAIDIASRVAPVAAEPALAPEPHQSAQLAESLATRVTPQVPTQNDIAAPPPMPAQPIVAPDISVQDSAAKASPTTSPNSLSASMAAARASANAPSPAAATPATSDPNVIPHSTRTTSNDGPKADADWQETTDFGYRIAASWDDDDPNVAINEATKLARSGKTFEEITAYLVSCNVSPDEAEYVTAMTGARRAAPKSEGGAAALRRGGRGRRVALAIAMIVAGVVVAYLGYAAWQNGADTGRRSPLSIAAVGGALILNGLRTLATR